MRSGPILLALLLTAGCNLADRDRDDQRSERVEREATGNDQAVSEAPDNGAVERNEQVKGAELASSAPRDPGGVNREWFAGSWTDSGDCAQAGEFNRDGRYRLAGHRHQPPGMYGDRSRCRRPSEKQGGASQQTSNHLRPPPGCN